MNRRAKRGFGGISTSVLALAAALLVGTGSARAGTKYFADGALQNARGGWDLPKQGSCPADATAKTRPECLSRRYAAASSSACTALGAAGLYSWSTGICTDLVNTTQATCEAAGDRHWNANGSCAVVMEDDDRNALTCVKHGGTWVTAGTCTAAWVMPSRSDPAYGPGGLLVNDSASGAAGAGDQCLRCHNNRTQYNNPRVRDTEDVLWMGHKNMSRPVDQKTFKPWGGPPFSCTGHPSETTEEGCVTAGGTWDPTIYPADDTGNAINWNTNKITVGTNSWDLKWIYGDWLSALPRAIYVGPTLNNMSYSCGRCHTTGWTSDAGTTPNAAKHPELDFPGITWNGTGTTGQVKLGGGVAGDANVMSSWDQWGIVCSRCHYSAVDDTTSAPNFKAPSGMGTHNNGMTSPNNNAGVCTDLRWSSAPAGSTLEDLCKSTGGSFLTACSVNPTAGACTVAANTQAKCTAVAGATWVATSSGWCSNAFYTDSASCTANAYTWTAGWCKTADAASACTGGTGDGAKTWRLNGTQASCQLAGAKWTFTSCSVEGFCSKGTCSDPKYTNAVACETAGAFWNAIRSKATCDAAGGNFAYATDVVTCDDAGGRWNGNNTNRGQAITTLCMQCHRQETSGVPNTNGVCSDATKTTAGACIAAAGTWTESGNGIPLLVGPYHSTVAFPSHPHSNQFLNSPHAKFTGKWSEIATGKFDFSSDRKYQSSWLTWGESYNTGNGCTGCHDVHTSTVTGEKPFATDCAECHHAATTGKIQHPGGAGTPLEKIATEPMEACVTCHMPGGLHLFRINPDKAYSTFPMPQAMAGNVAPNTAPDGTFTNAVWVDLDAACGQCHGGGAAQSSTTGTVATGSASLTVASATGLAVGEKIRVVGAGAYYYDDIGHSSKYSDFDTYVKAIAGNVVTLAGTATKGVTNAAVVQNVTTADASYMTKATLALQARGMHVNPNPLFTALAGANSMTVAVDASATKCSGDIANCSSFDFDWGDGSVHGTTVTGTHAYATAGTYTITLTVKSSAGSAKATQTYKATAPAGAPVVHGDCTPTYATASVTCTLAVPASGYSLVTVDYGDRTTSEKANATGGTLSFTHTYQDFDNYAITATVVDGAGLETRATIGSMARATFISEMPSISGTVVRNGQPVASAMIVITRDGKAVANTMTKADGSYTTGKIKHGTYGITVNGKAFGPFTIGPSLTNQMLVAE